MSRDEPQGPRFSPFCDSRPSPRSLLLPPASPAQRKRVRVKWDRPQRWSVPSACALQGRGPSSLPEAAPSSASPRKQGGPPRPRNGRNTGARAARAACPTGLSAELQLGLEPAHVWIESLCPPSLNHQLFVTVVTVLCPALADLEATEMYCQQWGIPLASSASPLETS